MLFISLIRRGDGGGCQAVADYRNLTQLDKDADVAEVCMLNRKVDCECSKYWLGVTYVYALQLFMSIASITVSVPWSPRVSDV